MKKFLLLLCISILTLSLTPKNTVNASTEEFMRVLSNGVYIYSDSDFNVKLFEIPCGYYLKVINTNGGIVKVSYGNSDESYPTIMGYCKLSELTKTDVIPTKPYAQIKVSCSLSDVLFNDYNLSKPYFNVPENTFMVYYGKLIRENGSEICYVYCNNKLGYFDLNSLNPFTVPDSPDKIETEKPDDGKEEIPQEENEKPSSLPAESLQIIIIIGLSVISISIVYYLFKPSKQKRDDEEFFTEEN